MLKVIGLLFIVLASTSMGQQGNVKNTIIVIRTELGDITVELYADKAPVTVANFLQYIDSSRFDSASFYRVVRADNQPKDSVKIAVIQGGRSQSRIKGFPPIKLESTQVTGILHKDGVISMARSTPNSGTSEFFICVGDQPELDFGGKRNKDGQGFAAFGKVIKGSEVVRKIHDIKAPGQYLDKRILIYEIVKAGN
jgi:peptidyl-prolyl cis-trans isomerase A (cyclophilin A)